MERTRKAQHRGVALIESLLLVAFLVLVTFPAASALGNACNERYEDVTLAFGGGTQTTSTEGEPGDPAGPKPILELIE